MKILVSFALVASLAACQPGGGQQPYDETHNIPDVACASPEVTCARCGADEVCVELAVKEQTLAACVKTCDASTDCQAGIECASSKQVTGVDTKAQVRFCADARLDIDTCGWWSANVPPAISCDNAAKCVGNDLQQGYGREDQLWCGTKTTHCDNGCVTDCTGTHCE